MAWTDWLPTIVSGVAGVAGSIIGANAIGSATDKTAAATIQAAAIQAQSTKEALDLQRQMYNSGVSTSYPHLQLQTQAMTPYGTGMGLSVPQGGYPVPTLKSLMLPDTTIPATTTPNTTTPSLGSLPPTSTVNPGSTVGSVAKGAFGGAGTGAMIGSIAGPIGTVIGAGAGALIGGVSGLIGRGRKEADQIVPYQNQLTSEFTNAYNNIKAKDAAGTLTQQDWKDAVSHLEPLYNDFQGLIQKFGRAGPGAAQTTAYMGNMLNDWKGYAASPNYPSAPAIPGKASGGRIMGSGMKGEYVVGEKGPEILKMAPGSEGYIYPHSTFVSMMRKRMPGRQTGGEVDYSGQPGNDPSQNYIARVLPYGGPGIPAPKPATPVNYQGNPGMMQLPQKANDVMNPPIDTGAPQASGEINYTRGAGVQLLNPFDQSNASSPPPIHYGNAPVAPVTGTPSNSPTNPYADMQAPYNPTPGEFLQPWQEPLNTPTINQSLATTPPINQALPGRIDVNQDPGYQFRLQEGIKANERLASARGDVLGGRTLKELTRYGQDYGSNEYANAYARAQGENQTAYGRSLTAYNQAQTQNQTAYQRQQDEYNRILNEYGIRYDIFKQNQGDRYNRLLQAAGGGG